MKKSALLLITFIVLSCGHKSETVTVSREKYKILTGDTIRSKYPKEIIVNSDDSDNSPGFTVFIGSDGHEYQRHEESHRKDQWVHYAGCELCKSRLDTILSHIKNLEKGKK